MEGEGEGTKDEEGGRGGLHTIFHLNMLIGSTSGSKKSQLWCNFEIWGTPIPTPFYRCFKFGAFAQIHGIWLHAKFRLY